MVVAWYPVYMTPASTCCHVLWYLMHGDIAHYLIGTFSGCLSTWLAFAQSLLEVLYVIKKMLISLFICLSVLVFLFHFHVCAALLSLCNKRCSPIGTAEGAAHGYLAVYECLALINALKKA